MNWDYIAGFWDGEGSIAIYHGNHGQRIIMVHASQNTRVVLDEISQFLHQHGIDNRVVWADKKWHLYRIIMTKVGACTLFLEFIKDLLIVKKQKANEVYEYIVSNRWRGWLTEQDKQKILELNKLGYTRRQLSNELNRDYQTISRFLGSKGLTKRGGKYTWNLKSSIPVRYSG